MNPNKLWCKPRKMLCQALCCLSSPSPPQALSLHYFQHLSASLVAGRTRTLWPTVIWICTAAWGESSTPMQRNIPKWSQFATFLMFLFFLGTDQLFQWDMRTLWITMVWIPVVWQTGEKHDCSLGNLSRWHWLQEELVQSLVLQVL